MTGRLHIIILLLLISFPILQAQIPLNTGFMVYHSYSSYEGWDSKLFLLDLETGELEQISSTWAIDHEMNGHISPDGNWMVFMGDDAGEPRDWDIYLWEIGSNQPPQNLTIGNNKRDEDPKFSPDGSKIVIKQSFWSSSAGGFIFDIQELDLSGNIINTVSSYDQTEESMPYYTTDGNSIVYATGGGANGDIEIINTDGSGKTILENSTDIQEYYPIVRDDTSYYFTKWVSASNHHDQVYIGSLKGKPATSAAFNTSAADYSDAYPAGDDMAFFSSTRSGGKGAYDLYLGNIKTGDIWSLDNIAMVNTTRNELGACYNPNSLLYDRSLYKDPEINIFPNPVQQGSEIKIELPCDYQGKASILVYNSLGILIKRIKPDYKDSFSISTPYKGFYIINILYDGKIHTKKLMVR